MADPAPGFRALLYVGLGEPHRAHPSYQARWIMADGIRTRALEAGHGDTTLLFLHGYGESLLTWRLLLDRFTRHYRLLAVDLPGFGLADKPDWRYDYPAYTAWLDSLVTRYTAGPVVVVGHSMGGELAAGLALDHPERVVAAVLIDPAGAGINPLLADTAGIAAPTTHWVASAIPFVLPVHDSAWLRDPPGAARYQPTGDSGAGRAAQAVLQRFDFAALEPRLGSLRQPVLLIWGRHDPTIPYAIGRRMAASLPCRRFVTLQTLHRPHQTMPDTVAAEMSAFLARPACDRP
jgi:pimeloyl-ACP methyl ester carboxylesterase